MVSPAATNSDKDSQWHWEGYFVPSEENISPGLGLAESRGWVGFALAVLLLKQNLAM